MKKITNKIRLVENGKTQTLKKARKLALDSLEKALEACDPTQIVLSKIHLTNSIMKVDNLTFDLKEFDNVYVVGGGKASGSMAVALERKLGKYLSGGFINVPIGEKRETRIIELHEAQHPIPDKAAADGAKKILELARKAGKNDLLICLISGGGSSLMTLPKKGISLEDQQLLTNLLLKSGARIEEINIVRKHISEIKGGWLAKTAYPATLLNLILSDVVGDPLDSIASGPTVPDSSSYLQARQVLEKYLLWERISPSIRKIISNGIDFKLDETPKPGDPVFERVYNVVTGNIRRAGQEVCNYLKSEGLNTLLLSAEMEGEARHIGTFFASIAKEISKSGYPIPRPAAVIAGGETTVVVNGNGKGGRNQELSLSASMKIKGLEDCVLVSMSTDGVDGPTDAAGAVADSNTILRAQNKGLNPEQYLSNNDSYSFFSEIKDLIITGPTGTNVNDLTILVLL